MRNRDIPYAAAEIGGEAYLTVRGEPYPGSFSADTGCRPRIDLVGSWERSLGEASPWEGVQVPEVFNAALSPQVGYLGVVRYRRRFALGPEFLKSGRRLRLCCEGLLLRGEVILNGRPAGSYEGGYTPNYFDISAPARAENLLEIRCDNRLTPDSLPPKIKARHNPGWHTYGGIHRPVYLELLPERSAFSLRYLALPARELRLLVREEGGEPSAAGVRGRLLTGKGEADLDFRPAAYDPKAGVSLWKAPIPEELPETWSPESPLCSTVRIELYGHDGRTLVDRVEQRRGFREFRVDGERLLLNGRELFLKGICKHEDHPRYGAVQPKELIESDLELIRRMGANYIRLAHYPHAETALDAAEKAGILLSEEIPLYQAGTGFAAWFQEREPWYRFPLSLFGTRQTGRRGLRRNAERMLMEMIERDRHRGAILFWSLGNECYTLGRRGARLFRRLARLAKRFDPERPVTYVELTYNRKVLDRHRLGWSGADILSLNSYFGWYYGSVEDLGAHLDEIRRRWPNKPLILSEFGAGAAPGRSEEDGPWRAERVAGGKSYSEEYQAELIEAYWRTAKERTWIAGFSPWVFADFYNIWFPSNPVPNYNLKGVVSRERVPKAAYRLLQALYRPFDGEHDG